MTGVYNAVHRDEYFNVIALCARIAYPPEVPAQKLVLVRYPWFSIQHEIGSIKPEVLGINFFGSNKLLAVFKASCRDNLGRKERMEYRVVWLSPQMSSLTGTEFERWGIELEQRTLQDKGWGFSSLSHLR